MATAPSGALAYQPQELSICIPNFLQPLDEIAKNIIRRKPGALLALSALSTGERLYVHLAANRAAKVKSRGETIAYTLARIGPYWAEQLIERWQYNGFPNPELYEAFDDESWD